MGLAWLMSIVDREGHYFPEKNQSEKVKVFEAMLGHAREIKR